MGGDGAEGSSRRTPLHRALGFSTKSGAPRRGSGARQGGKEPDAPVTTGNQRQQRRTLNQQPQVVVQPCCGRPAPRAAARPVFFNLPTFPHGTPRREPLEGSQVCTQALTHNTPRVVHAQVPPSVVPIGQGPAEAPPLPSAPLRPHPASPSCAPHPRAGFVG